MGDMMEGRVALVTGGGRGLGRATALALAAEGAKLVVNDLGVLSDGSATAESPAEEVARLIRESGGEALASHHNVATLSGAQQAVQTAAQSFGRLDALIMFAGIVRGSTLSDTSEDEWDAVMSVHVKGQFACARFAAEHMKQQRYGRIVCVTSGQGHMRVQPGIIAYGTAKRGVLGLMTSLAHELRGDNITVNAFSPLALTRLVTGGESDPARIAARIQQSELLRNMYPPEEIAPAVVYLASEASAGTTGQIVYMNGPELSVIAPLYPIETIQKQGRWTIAELTEAVPRFLQPAIEAGRTAGGAAPRIPPAT